MLRGFADVTREQRPDEKAAHRFVIFFDRFETRADGEGDFVARAQRGEISFAFDARVHRFID